MAKMISRTENQTDHILEREFSAAQNLVFKMFTDGEQLKKWWGPRGWELPVSKMDFRVNGTWLYCMKCVDKNQGKYFGMESWGKMVFHEIKPTEKLVYTDYFSDADGKENNDLPASTTTMNFLAEGNKTKIISRTKYANAEALKTVLDMGMLQGITETWDRLEEALVKK